MTQKNRNNEEFTKKKLLIFDTNIFLTGINFNLIEGIIYTSPKVIEEITVNRYAEKNRNIINKIVHWHNTYVDEPAFLQAVAPTFELQETIRFGMYGFLSKVVHTLLVQPEEPSFDAPLNEVAARIARKIPDFEGCSHQVLFVFRKR